MKGNEFEIIDVSLSNQQTASKKTNNLISQDNAINNSIRYPLVEGPIFINSVDEAPTAVTTAIGITAEVLSLFGVPGATLGGALLNALVDSLWPGNTSSNTVWGTFAAETAALLNEVYDPNDPIVKTADTALKGLHESLKLYQNAFTFWKNSPDNDNLKKELRIQFDITNNQFFATFPAFEVQGHETKLLTNYAQAANLHLSFLRDIAMYGMDWEFSQEHVDFNYTQQKERTAKYSDHCIKWYNEGLNKLKGNSTATNWYIYNRYRREMTLMVLDIVALFPNYDTKLYPIATTTELTRIIYTDPIAYSLPGDRWYERIRTDFSSIEEKAILKPGFVKWLKKIDIISNHWKTTNVGTEIIYWAGHKLNYSFTNSLGVNGVYYGSNTPYIEPPDSFDFSSADVYRTISNVRTTKVDQFATSEVRFLSINNKNILNDDLFKHQSNWKYPEIKDSKTELSIDSDNPSAYGDTKQYSHRLSYISEAHNDNPKQIYIPTFCWTHTSVSPDNRITPDKITQIPAVKSSSTEGGTWQGVAKGPGFTGSDVVTASSPSFAIVDVIKIHVNTEQASGLYHVRIRYAADTPTPISATLYTNKNAIITHDLKFPHTASQPFTEFNSFGYTDVPVPLNFPEPFDTVSVYLHLDALGGTAASIQVDRIEFIPITSEHEGELELAKAKKSVDSLFKEGKNALKLDATDYQIDQIANLVECLPEEVNLNEKRMLLNAVKYAKRLSLSRNLLEDSNLTSFNTEKGWSGSSGISISEGGLLFKGPYLRLPGGSEDGKFSTYLYQKIDESKLQAYTRYQVRGFIETSKDLELYVVRYDGKTHTVMDVISPFIPMYTSTTPCGYLDKCKSPMYIDPYLKSGKNLTAGNEFSNQHNFSVSIDTGSIDLNENIGIWVIFKINTPNGYATLGNIECVTERPLVGEALARVKKKEEKWKNKLEEIKLITQQVYKEAELAVANLFVDSPQDTKLKLETSSARILTAQRLAQRIPEIYNAWVSDVKGRNYSLFAQLEERIQQALNLYSLRNLVLNPNFEQGINDWNVTSDVKVQYIQGIPVLVLSNWNAQVNQLVPVHEERGYVLQVTAKKVGPGDGFVSVSDGVSNTETLNFNNCNGLPANLPGNYVTHSVEIFPDSEKVF
uniref:insecticidal delta-endotoxin Cry8Ea1 family protein n=1 Tax=Bacillus cereus TaxID=1396 RepID=UPI0005CF27E2